MRYFLILICSILPLLRAATLHGEEQPSEAYSVRFCRPNNMVADLLYIAESKNFFNDHGISATFLSATNAKICQDMLIAGKADMMTGAEGPFTYIAASNPPLTILARTQENPETAIFARKDRQIKTFADLRGKRIGYLPGTVSFFFLARVLKKYNMQKSDVSLSALQPPAMPQALVGGAIDAFSMWEPWGTAALQRLGDQGIMLSDPELYRYQALLTGRNEFIAENPKSITQTIRALLDAEHFIKNHSDEAFTILERAIAFEASAFKRLWPHYVHHIDLTDQPLRQMEENFALLKAEDENFKDSAIPDFRRYVNPSFLKEVAPDRVALQSSSP